METYSGPKCNTSFPLEPALISDLDKVAGYYGKSRSELCRDHLKELVAREKKRGVINF